MRDRISGLIGLLLLAPLLAAVAVDAPAADAAVRTKVTLSVYPALVGQNAGGYANRTPYAGKATPARKGATVFLERRNTAGRWVVIARSVQNYYGNFKGTYVAKRGERVRVRTKPGRVNRLVASPIRTPAHLKLKFAEDFSGSALNANRWETREQHMHGSRMCSKPSADMVKVGSGVATLSVRRYRAPTTLFKTYSENTEKGLYECKYGLYHNAMIGTKSQYQYKYGVFAARVKFQAAKGMHGGFWLQGPEKTGAEIDVAEYFGATSPEKLTILVHHTSEGGSVTTYGKRGKQLPTQTILGKKTPDNSYHVYSVDWTPKGYRFFLDGKPMMTTAKPFVSQAPEEVVLSMLTSDWELNRLTTTNSSMKVDWVRVWQR